MQPCNIWKKKKCFPQEFFLSSLILLKNYPGFNSIRTRKASLKTIPFLHLFSYLKKYKNYFYTFVILKCLFQFSTLLIY